MTDNEKEEVKQMIREQLQDIFGVMNIASRIDDPLHAAVLQYLSKITLVHTNAEVQKNVDNALGNALRMYCEVNKLEEQQIVEVVKNLASNQEINQRFAKLLREHMRQYAGEVIDVLVPTTSYSEVATAKQAYANAIKRNLPY